MSLTGTGVRLWAKERAEVNPSMWAGSTEDLEMGKCGVEGTMASSQMASSPGYLAQRWAHKPVDQLPDGQGERARWAPPACQAGHSRSIPQLREKMFKEIS